MHRQLRRFAGLALLALLLAAPGLALAHGDGPQQTVDGYTVTLIPPEQGFLTGSNPVTVLLWDWRGNAPEATVLVQLLAFAPPADGHGDSHGEADSHAAVPADSHAAAPADSHAAVPADGHAAAPADGHAAAPTDGHAAGAAEHAHDGATEGQGLAAPPGALTPAHDAGEYAGGLTFDRPGTYTLSVVFTIDGEERGAIFDVAVAQRRPRGLVLGGFALVNALAIGAAYLIKRRAPVKATKPARPAPAKEEPR